MGAIVNILKSMLTFFSTAGIGWMVSDYSNESERTKQLAAANGQQAPEPFSLIGSILGANWKKYLIGIAVGGAIIYIINLLINRSK